MKKFLMIAAILALSVSVSFAIDGSCLVNNGIGFKLPSQLSEYKDNGTEKKDDHEKTVEKEFKAAKGKTLRIDLKTGGALTIKGWDKELVNIKATIGGRDAKDCTFDFNETDNGVEITSRYTGHKRGWSTECELEIMVPDRFNLSLYTMGGTISLSNIDGEITGKTLGGALALEHLKGYLDLKTLGGAVNLTDSDVDGRVETLGGPVLMHDVKGNIKSHTMSGNVKISNDID
ncbi:MAG TPA: hypothetical protein VHO03_08170 [Ignavibacteriales bacterium]|nr:hypothetical protein [Ignavibacteriales bacterium]